jgi:hypothetical protein
MNARKIFLFFFATILVSACAQKSAEMKAEADILEQPVDAAQSQLANVPSNDLYSDGKTKLIKTANYRFEVENVKESTEAIIKSIKKYPAYVSSSSLHLENPVLENKMTIRVQNEYFHELLQEIDQQALFVNNRDVTTDDVSKEFVDLESRLKTKREVEARYMEILRKKAGTIEELLNAERQIGELHEEIEATISRINHLREQVSYSTINLEFYQTITQELKAYEEPRTADEFKGALKAGLDGIIAVGLLLTYIWPLILIGLGVLGYIRFKNIKRKAEKVA